MRHQAALPHILQATSPGQGPPAWCPPGTHGLQLPLVALPGNTTTVCQVCATGNRHNSSLMGPLPTRHIHVGSWWAPNCSGTAGTGEECLSHPSHLPFREVESPEAKAPCHVSVFSLLLLCLQSQSGGDPAASGARGFPGNTGLD